jgi:hypothetical protein
MTTFIENYLGLGRSAPQLPLLMIQPCQSKHPNNAPKSLQTIFLGLEIGMTYLLSCYYRSQSNLLDHFLGHESIL